MLRTLPMTRDYTNLQRIAVILLFVVLIALSAQIKVYFGSPVPITLQVLVVLLSGMVLGARDGMLAQVAYIGLLALNLPIDAAQTGNAVFSGATIGYILGFIPAAGVTGLLVEKSSHRLWQYLLAGLVGVAVIYMVGVPLLMRATGLDFQAAWAAGVTPFIGVDIVKALIAAGFADAAYRRMPQQKSRHQLMD